MHQKPSLQHWSELPSGPTCPGNSYWEHRTATVMLKSLQSTPWTAPFHQRLAQLSARQRKGGPKEQLMPTLLGHLWFLFAGLQLNLPPSKITIHPSKDLQVPQRAWMTHRCTWGTQTPCETQVLAESNTCRKVEASSQRVRRGKLVQSTARRCHCQHTGLRLLSTGITFPTLTYLYPPFLFGTTTKTTVNTLSLDRGHHFHPSYILGVGFSPPQHGASPCRRRGGKARGYGHGWQRSESEALSLVAHPLHWLP